MYSLAIYIYMFCVNVAAFFGHRKARQMMHGHRDTWRILREKISPEDRPVWFHAASLGEFEQGRPLMERLRKGHPEKKILLTFFSPSGYEVRKDYAGADVICYLPFDTMLNARKFLRLAHPSKAFFIKYEFWSNYLNQLHRQGVPIISVSSIFRPKQIFFRWYNFGYSYVLRRVSHFFVQNTESQRLLQRKGIFNVTVAGDTRFDRVVEISKQAKRLPVCEAFVGSSKKVFVVGSSWEADEDVYLPYFPGKGWKIIIAPHVVNEGSMERLQARLAEMGLTSLLYTEAEKTIAADAQYAASAVSPDSADVLIINCYGLLSSIYQFATIAYVGGGFGVGIHNVPEAAVYGVPVIIGPNNERFREAQYLLGVGSCREVSGVEAFRNVMDIFENDKTELERAGKRAYDYIHSNAGAADMIYRETLA